MWKLKKSKGRGVMRQIRDNLERGNYPLIVTEGTGCEKLDRIGQSRYLAAARERFMSLSGPLFIHGASLGSSDQHISDALSGPDSAVDSLYVGVYGDPKGRSSRRLIDAVEGIQEARAENDGRDLNVSFYDSGSVSIWH